MATTLEIIRGISQAAANGYDGALDDKGEPISIGLRREEGDPIIDSRVIDGFSVRAHGNILKLTYQSEIKLQDVHDKNFESDTEQTIQDIANFLKKEYKKVTGNALTLTPQGEAKILVQNTSKIRVFIVANKDYKIGNIGDVDPVAGGSKDSVDAKFKSFLEQGGLGERPDNDKRKE
tara:strand:- start:2064 stop:2594 length:531 start_codon:yes stop_codon:yes gene_type:complete